MVPYDRMLGDVWMKYDQSNDDNKERLHPDIGVDEPT
jgi:hypothetical protein